MPRKSATVKALWMTQTVCTNLIIYEKDDTQRARVPRPFVSGVKFDREAKTLVSGAQGIRTMTLPKTFLQVQ